MLGITIPDLKPEETTLKPCPFCGVYPTLDCDLTDWRGKPVYTTDKSQYRPTTYRLKANHRKGCYIYHMDGTNSEGRTTSANWQTLVDKWNRRAE